MKLAATDMARMELRTQRGQTRKNASATGIPARIILLVNPTGSNLVGTERSFASIISPELRERFQDFLQQVFQEPSKWSTVAYYSAGNQSSLVISSLQGLLRVTSAVEAFTSGESVGLLDRRVVGLDGLERWIANYWSVDLGAAGYFIKQIAAHILPQAVREIHQGHSLSSPTITARLSNRKQLSATGPFTQNCVRKLTAREMELLHLVVEGKANKESADVLPISIKTVENHRQNVIEKFNIHDTATLTRYAISNGFVESSVQVMILSKLSDFG